MEHILKIKNLVKTFEGFTAVDSISLDIKKGEIFGILGPNGAGKTTTINMILGLLKPTSGSITINGIDIAKHGNDVKKMMGLMTQETVVDGDLTARDNLEIFAELYHVPASKIPGKVKEALAESELTEFADKKAGTFSGGMQRRLALVKSMIQDPMLLILDEPTTGLDIQNRVSMWGHIKGLIKIGVTIILTTQYLEEADALCDRIAIIDHGKIKAIGTASELKRMVGTGRVLEIVLESESQAQSAASLLKSHFKINPIVKGDRLDAIIEKWDPKMLPEMLSLLEKKKLIVSSVNVHFPTLDDVFIKLTGSGMRDSASNEYVSARSSAMVRGR
ncbi:MAG: ABC transporter ATP-binding protein [Candidatus Micrarchaeaceae archaeon]